MTRKFVLREKLMKKSNFILTLSILISAVSVLLPETSFARIDVPWENTFDCAEMSQLSPGGPANWILNCGGLTGGGGHTTSSGNVEAITTAANYPGGGGGRGQRHWIGPGKNDNSGGISHNFSTRQTELWMRWYMRYEKGYQIQSLSGDTFAQKQLYFGLTENHILYMMGSRWKVLINGSNYIADAPGGFGAHFGGNTVSSHGEWVCIEYHFKLDNPKGSSNGIVELWVNNVPIFSHKNVNLGISNLNGYDNVGWPENAQGSVGVPNGSGGFRDGYQDLDDKVISNTGRIGCISGPTPPKNLQVQ